MFIFPSIVHRRTRTLEDYVGTDEEEVFMYYSVHADAHRYTDTVAQVQTEVQGRFLLTARGESPPTGFFPLIER